MAPVATPPSAPAEMTANTFSSGDAVRWCPGCGDYSILAAVQSVLAKQGKSPDQYAFVSGIGCSSRFPHYMSTYGFHTIHGRALAVATGVKAANPDLETWVITGDGDCLSIGGNHMIHALRKNQDLKILLFNNKVYGLTKGQFSPTSPQGKVSMKSAPYGHPDMPVHPLALALASEASFVARTADNDVTHLRDTLTRAANHKGSAFVEILQNCVVFLDKIHEDYYGLKTRKDNVLYLEHGKPLTFGASVEKGLFMEGGSVHSLAVDEDNRGKVMVHNEGEESGLLAYMLARLDFPDFPVPLGVLRDTRRPTYDEILNDQVKRAREQRGEGDLAKLLKGSKTWEVK
jgi:2-oxoglutarate ferredoxin oxidoreductase subunit beta